MVEVVERKQHKALKSKDGSDGHIDGYSQELWAVGSNSGHGGLYHVERTIFLSLSQAGKEIIVCPKTQQSQ